MVRINGRTNEAVNEEWTCDRGKFGHEFYNGDKRLTKPLIRRGDSLVQASWAEAYDEILKASSGRKVALLGGNENSNEDIFMAKRVLKQQLGSDLADHRFQSHPLTVKETEALNLKQKPIRSYEDAKAIVIFGTSLADEEPILYLRVRKAWAQRGVTVIVACDRPTDADEFASAVLRYKPGSELVVANALAGNGDATGSGVSAEALSRAKAEIRGLTPDIITTRSIYNAADAPAVLTVLSKTGDLSVYGLSANDQGAHDLGLICEGGAREILSGCAESKVDCLWLLGADPFAAYPERDRVQKAIENVGFLVVLSHTENEAFHYASVVLPMCAPAEMEGTYTNLERRVQRMDQVLPTRGEAKPAWRVFSELALRMSGERPFFGPGEIMQEIAREVFAFSGIDYDALSGTEGVILLGARETAKV